MKNLRKLMPVTMVLIATGITSAVVSWPGGASARLAAASATAFVGHRFEVAPTAAPAPYVR